MLTTHDVDIMAKDARQTPILRGIMYFLTCHHSEQEFQALRWKLTTCRCNFGDPVIARLHLGDPGASGPNQGRDNIPSPNIDTALASLCAVIAQALQPLPVGKLRKALRNARADAQPWPNNQEDIISSPEGIKGTIAALLRWAIAPPSGYGVFLVLGGLARFWDPYAREILRTPRALSLATDHIRFALDHYDARTAADDPVVANNFHLPLLACADEFLLKLVVRDMQATYTAMGPVMEQMMHIALEMQPILRAMSPSVPHPWFDQMELTMKEANMIRVKDSALPSLLLPAALFIFLSGVVAFLIIVKPRKLTRIILILLALIAVMSLIPTVLRLSSIYLSYSWLRASNPQTMFRRLVYIRNLNQCMHLACTAPLGVKTAVCVQCGIVRYCGSQVRPRRPALPSVLIAPAAPVSAPRMARTAPPAQTPVQCNPHPACGSQT
jgi:hypothetical protein